LGQLDDEAVGVGEVRGTVAPRAVRGRADDGGPVVCQSPCVAVNVVDHEHDFGSGSRCYRLPGQPFGAAPFVEPEAGSLRRELGVSGVLELERQSEGWQR
jgi:hypothetical protein